MKIKLDNSMFKEMEQEIKHEIAVEAVRIAKASMRNRGRASEPGEVPNVRTGKLKRSINTGPRGDVVQANAPYAAELETGSREVKARPFLQKAVEKAMRNLGY